MSFPLQPRNKNTITLRAPVCPGAAPTPGARTWRRGVAARGEVTQVEVGYATCRAPRATRHALRTLLAVGARAAQPRVQCATQTHSAQETRDTTEPPEPGGTRGERTEGEAGELWSAQRVSFVKVDALNHFMCLSLKCRRRGCFVGWLVSLVPLMFFGFFCFNNQLDVYRCRIDNCFFFIITMEAVADLRKVTFTHVSVWREELSLFFGRTVKYTSCTGCSALFHMESTRPLFVGWEGTERESSGITCDAKFTVAHYVMNRL